MARDWTAAFNAAHADPVSRTFSDLMTAAMGDEHPRELGPYSWISRSELAAMADVVRTTGSRVVDIGCGRGGPGLWVAGETGAHLTGIDIAQAGLDAAARSAQVLGVEADFRLGSFSRVPLPDGAADVVMSVDAFLFEPDREAGAAELKRVLRPGGRLAMTSWDYHSQPVNRPPQVADHRPLLESAGFLVERYDETPDWEDRQRHLADGLLDNVDALAAEQGQDPDRLRSEIEEMRTTTDCMIRRFLLVARREG